MSAHLRPLERRVRRLQQQGLSDDEIAWRFRRSPGSIRRIAALSELQRPAPTEDSSTVLRPIERVVRAGIDRGLADTEIAARLRRSPEWVRRVQHLSEYKLTNSV